MSAPGAAPGARQFVSLWELPAARFEGASVAALHGGGYRAVQAEAAQPAGDASAAAAADGADADAQAVGRTDAWRDKGFASVDEWRAHTRSDLYRLNQRRRASGRAPLTEDEFESMLRDGGEVSSISGSDSDSSEEEGGGGAVRAQRGASARADLSAKVVFSDASGALFAVWRAALASPREEKEDAAWARKGSAALQRLRSLRASQGLWLLLLARGGHFAALVVRMSAAGPSGVAAASVVAHRTFHRYVVRAKQGGRQGTKDATGKSIKSAGSALRRANEAALERDVRALLEVEWRQHVASAELVWLALSDTDRRMVVGGEGAPVARDDARLRRIPFGTRRPTLNEAKRVAAQLAAVELGIAPAPEELAAQPEAVAAAAPGSSDGDGSDSDADADTAAKQRYVDAGADPTAGDTPLHTAARAGDAAAVAQLLAGGADPGARNVRGRVAYSVARDRATRDVFRRARAAAEDAWDWGAAGVTSALTPEMEAAQAAKRAAADAADRAREKERRRAAKERKKQRDADAAAALQAAAEREARDAEALAAAAAGSRSKASSLLESARAAERAAREERAAAAERRFATLGVGGSGVRGGGAAGPCAPEPPAAVPWGSGSIAGGPVAAPAAGAEAAVVSAAGAPFGAAPAPAFGSAAPAFGAPAAAAPPPQLPPGADAALAALAARVTSTQAALLARILSNAAENPADAKLRRLRLSNPKVQDALLASGALAGLLALFGWATEGGGAEEAFAVQSEADARAQAPAMLHAARRLAACA